MIGVDIRAHSHIPCNAFQISDQTFVCFIAQNNKNRDNHIQKNIVNNQEKFNNAESNLIFTNQRKSISHPSVTVIHET
jgi:hypothetical protein